MGTPAGAATSSAQVVELAVLPEISLGDVIGLLTADVISPECTSDASGSTGSASLVEATVAETALDATPEPNTTIEVDLAVLGSTTVVMNEQMWRQWRGPLDHRERAAPHGRHDGRDG